MAISLNTNINSLKAQGDARKLNEDIQSSTEKLSSGSRITHASDDAASLAMSEKFKANIRSNYQSSRNANDAISVIQTIEGNLNSISELSVRMRELAVQAATDTNGAAEKTIANTEFQGLKNEIYRIISVSRYSDRSAISGTSELLQSQLVDRAPRSFDFRVGGGTSEGQNTIRFQPQKLMMSREDFNLTGSSIDSTSGARNALSELDQTIEKVSFSKASLGALQNQLGRAATLDDVNGENISAANSRIRDLDYASETAKNIKNKILSESNVSIQSQANTNPQLLTKLLS